MTTHRVPPSISGQTPCCNRSIFDLPRGDRLASDPGLIDCEREEA